MAGLAESGPITTTHRHPPEYRPRRLFRAVPSQSASPPCPLQPWHEPHNSASRPANTICAASTARPTRTTNDIEQTALSLSIREYRTSTLARRSSRLSAGIRLPAAACPEGSHRPSVPCASSRLTPPKVHCRLQVEQPRDSLPFGPPKSSSSKIPSRSRTAPFAGIWSQIESSVSHPIQHHGSSLILAPSLTLPASDQPRTHH